MHISIYFNTLWALTTRGFKGGVPPLRGKSNRYKKILENIFLIRKTHHLLRGVTPLRPIVVRNRVVHDNNVAKPPLKPLYKGIVILILICSLIIPHQSTATEKLIIKLTSPKNITQFSQKLEKLGVTQVNPINLPRKKDLKNHMDLHQLRSQVGTIGQINHNQKAKAKRKVNLKKTVNLRKKKNLLFIQIIIKALK